MRASNLKKPSLEERRRIRLQQREGRVRLRAQQEYALRTRAFAYIAYADGELSQEERNFASAHSIDISGSWPNSHHRRGSQQPEVLLPWLQKIPLTVVTITARRKLLRELKALCLCDGPLTTAESDALENITSALHLNKRATNSNLFRSFGRSTNHTKTAKKRPGMPHPTASQPTIPWYYEFLGCHPHDTDHTIKTAYRRLAAQYHPDKHSHQATTQQQNRQLVEAFQKLQTAYQEILTERKTKSKCAYS